MEYDRLCYLDTHPNKKKIKKRCLIDYRWELCHDWFVGCSTAVPSLSITLDTLSELGWRMVEKQNKYSWKMYRMCLMFFFTTSGFLPTTSVTSAHLWKETPWRWKIYTRGTSCSFYMNIFLTILQFLVGVVVWLYNFQLWQQNPYSKYVLHVNVK